VDWTHLGQDRDQWGGSCEHGYIPSNFITREKNFDWVTVSSSRWTLLHGIMLG
jgi:hypothetical protein